MMFLHILDKCLIKNISKVSIRSSYGGILYLCYQTHHHGRLPSDGGGGKKDVDPSGDSTFGHWPLSNSAVIPGKSTPTSTNFASLVLSTCTR